MFTRAIPVLAGSIDPGGIPVPRPFDALAARCAAQAADALASADEFMPMSARAKAPDAYLRLQLRRRRQLESFLWSDANQASVLRMLDLIGTICEETKWSAPDALIDDPSHPEIDLQAAETGALLAWILRRHGARLKERDPRVPAMILGEIRRRLTAPAAAHDDYPFMRGAGVCPALILCDLLLTCLLTERAPSRRLPVLKNLLRALDNVCARGHGADVPLEEKLTDACAVADLALLIKRLTRGEADFTREAPIETWLDDSIICWLGGSTFVDPAGSGARRAPCGVDLFRLGYIAKDRALCALGAQLCREDARDSVNVTGRILSMEYMRAMQDETGSPPRPRRAVNFDGTLMLARCGGFSAAISVCGARGNAGSVSLSAGAQPILTDMGGTLHSLPLIDRCAPLENPEPLPPLDSDFSENRDIMSADLTRIYPESCRVNAYQRTLMTMRADGTVRLVDAFEFAQKPDTIAFRFVTEPHPVPLRDRVLIGPVTLRWDGEMTAEVTEADGCHVLTLSMAAASPRLICGFSFEMN